MSFYYLLEASEGGVGGVNGVNGLPPSVTITFASHPYRSHGLLHGVHAAMITRHLDELLLRVRAAGDVAQVAYVASCFVCFNVLQADLV